ncbi:MAG: response regulator, partial [Burkholderiales bacterium]
MSATMPIRPPAPPARGNSNVRALVVDEHSASRAAMRDLLHSIGVTQVQMAAEPVRAIRMMESERFGLVLCEMKFLSQMDGIQVLEYVRTRRLLRPSAAFVLVTSAPDRLTVAASREWQPDAIVLKPVVAESLGPRIEQAMRRRIALAPVHEAADRGDSQALLERVQALIREAGAPSLELLRWQANALVDLGRFSQAHEVCEQALSVKTDLP